MELWMYVVLISVVFFILYGAVRGFLNRSAQRKLWLEQQAERNQQYQARMQAERAEKIRIMNTPLDLSKVRISDLRDSIGDYALAVIKEQYEHKGKPIYKRKSNGHVTGEYKADFIVAVDKCRASVVNKISDDYSMLSTAFINYMTYYHSDDVTFKNFPVRLEEYIESPSPLPSNSDTYDAEQVYSYNETFSAERFIDYYQFTEDNEKAVKKYAIEITDSYCEQHNILIYLGSDKSKHTVDYKKHYKKVYNFIRSLVFADDNIEYNQLFWDFVYNNYTNSSPEDFDKLMRFYCQNKILTWQSNRCVLPQFEVMSDDELSVSNSEQQWSDDVSERSVDNIELIPKVTKQVSSIKYSVTQLPKYSDFFKNTPDLYKAHEQRLEEIKQRKNALVSEVVIMQTRDNVASVRKSMQSQTAVDTNDILESNLNDIVSCNSELEFNNVQAARVAAAEAVASSVVNNVQPLNNKLSMSTVSIYDGTYRCYPSRPYEISTQLLELIKTQPVLTREEFYDTRNENKKTKIPGCYVIYNIFRNKYYVGNADDIFRRVNEHIMGKQSGGNDLDYDICVKGHPFLIRLLPNFDAGYQDIVKMERELIAAYNSYIPDGYNKTRGNGRDK